jgi:hypothetical protein
VRLRLQGGRPPFEDWREGQLQWIREHAPGRSFADIGGLWMKAGDDAFAAEEAGATSVTCFDAGDPDLTEFEVKREAKGSKVRFVQGDLEDPESMKAVGPHDIVWCTGVLYHTPNPVRQLIQLREITRELLYLGTYTIPEIPGFPNACVYYPYLGDAEREVYATGYFWSEATRKGALGISTPFDETPMRGHSNCWWGISRSALRAMLRTARFEMVEERSIFPSPWLTELWARPIDADPLLPPISYFRERGQVREATGERLPFEEYWERQRGDGEA